ncbi:MAG: AAA family ATPase [Candidatus Gracilibacteria bacterium]|nr:AAA family ATPase [Candidatus Gracilibacteria bacterium]
MDKILLYSEEKISGVNTKFKRYLFDEIIENKNNIIGIVGLRGIGKTTLLLQIAKQRDKSVYFSMDSSFIIGKKIFNIVEELYKSYKILNFYIDEIHKYKNWEQDLKTIYDFLPDVKIIFSGSSSIDLIKGNYDLSRRGKIFNLNKFSFLEYLEFKHNIIFEGYAFEELINNYKLINFEIYKKQKNILELFKQYLKIGELGFALEEDIKDYREKLENIINKIVYEDISNFYKLKTENISYFFEILKFIANSAPSEINFSNIAKLLNTTSSTVKSYFDILIEIGFLNVMGKSGKISVQLRKTKKIYFEMQNFMNIFFDDINERNYIGVLEKVLLLQF